MSKEFVFKTDVSIEELDRRAQEFESKRASLWNKSMEMLQHDITGRKMKKMNESRKYRVNYLLN